MTSTHVSVLGAPAERYELTQMDRMWLLTCWTCEATVHAGRQKPDPALIADVALIHERENHE